MPHSEQTEELVIRGPVLVPMGWLVAIFGAAGTAVLMAFTIGIWAATISTKQEAQASEVIRIRDWRTTVSNDFSDVRTKVSRIETILEYKFPDAARAADSAK